MKFTKQTQFYDKTSNLNEGARCNSSQIKVADVLCRTWISSSLTFGFQRQLVPYRIIRSWYTGYWWLGCYIWHSEEGPGRHYTQATVECSAHDNALIALISVEGDRHCIVDYFQITTAKFPPPIGDVLDPVCSSVCLPVCLSVSRITAKVISRYHWNLALWSGLPLGRTD